MSATTVETTVTYLSTQTQPAHFPPMPMSPRLALMHAERIPLHFYRYLYDTVGRSCLWVERHGLSDEALAGHIHREGIEITVLYANGAPGGYYELDFAQPHSTNLVYFGLVPELTGMKIGPWLLGCAVRDAFARGASEVTVNTCTLDHPAALPLYQRLGFQPIRRELHRVSVPQHLSMPGRIASRIGP
jgi:GNAT superfamily N-acetyltransferase